MLIALETIANVLGRPFRLDFYFEQTCRLIEVGNYQWSIEPAQYKTAPLTVSAGPFTFQACVLPKVAAHSGQ